MITEPTLTCPECGSDHEHRAARAPAESVPAVDASPSAASIAWNALRDLTDPLGEDGVKIMGHVRVFAQRQYEAGLAEGSAARKKGGRDAG